MDHHAAKLLAAQWERETADPLATARRGTTLSDALDAFLEQRSELVKAGKRSAATVMMYSQKIEQLTRVLGDDLPLEALTAQRVDSYITARRRGGEGRKPVSEHTIHKEMVTLRAALRLARRRGTFGGDAGAILPIGFSQAYTPKQRALSRSEVKALLDALEPPHEARVAFIVATGARWGESERAERSDVDLEAGFVRLRGTKTAASKRTVPVLSLTRPFLAIAMRLGGKERLFEPWGHSRQTLEWACKRAGIARCSANDLRRTFATWLRAEGAAPDLIAPAMGHVNSKMVEMVYGRLSPEALKASLEASFRSSSAPARRSAKKAKVESMKQACKTIRSRKKR
jgi:integrase